MSITPYKNNFSTFEETFTSVTNQSHKAFDWIMLMIVQLNVKHKN